MRWGLLGRREAFESFISEVSALTWEEYYDKFCEWANSTQISRISKLESFGSADEVCEIANGLCDEAAATRLIKKAVAAGVAFSAEQAVELVGVINEAGLDLIINSVDGPCSREQLDDIYGIVSDEVFEAAVRRSGFDDSDDFWENSDEDGFSDEPEPKHKPGLFGQILLGITAGHLVSKLIDKRNGRSGQIFGQRNRHSGRCDGDCANCPPHYGYRHGRWYYGHHHQHGCEFGGNKGL